MSIRCAACLWGAEPLWPEHRTACMWGPRDAPPWVIGRHYVTETEAARCRVFEPADQHEGSESGCSATADASEGNGIKSASGTLNTNGESNG